MLESILVSFISSSLRRSSSDFSWSWSFALAEEVCLEFTAELGDDLSVSITDDNSIGLLEGPKIASNSELLDFTPSLLVGGNIFGDCLEFEIIVLPLSFVLEDKENGLVAWLSSFVERSDFSLLLSTFVLA